MTRSRYSAGVPPPVAGASRSRARTGRPRYGDRDFRLYEDLSIKLGHYL